MLRNCIFIVCISILMLWMKKITVRSWVTNLSPEYGTSRYDISWCGFVGKKTGRPKATDCYSVEQLENMGMRGLYARKELTRLLRQYKD